MKNLFYIIIIIFFNYNVLFSQAHTMLPVHFSNLRQGRQSNVSHILNDSTAYEATLNELHAYFSDSSTAVRKEAYFLARAIGVKTHHAVLRSRVTLALSRALADNEAVIVCDAAEGLTRFRLTDFSEEAKRNIGTLVETPRTCFGQIVLLAGFLNPGDKKNTMLQLLASGKLNAADQWNTRMALARMGDTEQIRFCVEKLRSVALNSRTLESVVKDLVYIRRKEAMDYVFEIINSDAATCRSSNPDNPVAVPCAYRALKYPAFAVKDYPIKPDTYGDVEIADYEKALRDVRAWHKKKKGKYYITTNVY